MQGWTEIGVDGRQTNEQYPLCLSAGDNKLEFDSEGRFKLLKTLYSIDTHFNTSTMTAFVNIVGKGEIAHNEQFILFPPCFLLKQIIVSPFVHIFDIISLFAAELEEPTIGISGKGLTLYHTTEC